MIRVLTVLACLGGAVWGVTRLPEPYRQWGINALVVVGLAFVPMAYAAMWLVGYGIVRHTIGRGVSDGFLYAAEVECRRRGL
jgi:hypothetical protein